MRLIYSNIYKIIHTKVINVLKVIAITNHELATTNYWDQIEQIAASDVDAIVLREKKLSEEEYTDYAKRALRLCSIHQKTCVLHQFGKAAIRLHIPRFQCSLEYLETHSSLLYYMTTLGVSVHSVKRSHSGRTIRRNVRHGQPCLRDELQKTFTSYWCRNSQSHLRRCQSPGLCLRRYQSGNSQTTPRRTGHRCSPHVRSHDL